MYMLHIQVWTVYQAVNQSRQGKISCGLIPPALYKLVNIPSGHKDAAEIIQRHNNNAQLCIQHEKHVADYDSWLQQFQCS